MNANYLYDIFEATEKLGLPDLTLGLAHVKSEKPIPEGMTDKGIRGFLAGHYETLVEAYKPHDREVFAAVVAECVAQDEMTEAE